MDEKNLVVKDLHGEESSLKLGFRSWRPAFLQRFNSVKVFLAILMLFSVSQGILQLGLVSASIPSLEKEFGFSSSVSGFIVAGNDLATIFVSGAVSFFGSRHKKPLIIGIGAAVLGLGALLFALPKLMIGKYEAPVLASSMSMDMCMGNRSRTYIICSSRGDSAKTTLSAIVLFIANFIMGAGVSPMMTLGSAYLDENVSPKQSPIYLGALYTSFVLGPGLGFLIASYFLKVYTDIDAPANLTSRDAGWVGAWWLGFVSMCGLLFLVSFLLMLFPRYTQKGKEKREKAIREGIKPASDQTIDYSLKGLLVQTLKLCKNKVIVCFVLAISAKTIYGAGIGVFFSKFLVIKFGMPASEASRVIGMIALPSMIVGVMGGSFLTKRLKTNARNAAKICLIVAVVSCITIPLFYLPGCRNTNLAGVILPYNNQSTTSGIDSQCNAGCDCSRNFYMPVCGDDGLTYHSPCYAGCSAMLNRTSFTNCTCIGNKAKAFAGKCDRGCKNAILFCVLAIVAIFIGFMGFTPTHIAIIRAVPDNQRAFALAFSSTVTKLLSFIPGPMIMGSVIDGECITWSIDSCGTKLNCLDYNMDNLSVNMVVFSGVSSVVGATFYFFGWWFYPVTPLNEQETTTAESQELVS